MCSVPMQIESCIDVDWPIRALCTAIMYVTRAAGSSYTAKEEVENAQNQNKCKKCSVKSGMVASCTMNVVLVSCVLPGWTKGIEK